MNLIDKKQKSSLLTRQEDIKPETTFNRNALFSSDEPIPKDKSKNAYKEKQTTLRVSESTSLEIKSLSLLKNLKNTNDVLSNLLDYYEAQLNVEEQRELKQIRKILSKK